MSEMLGNHFFMVRDFPSALAEFEGMLSQNSSLKKIQKKLIICYIQTGRIAKAFKLFSEIVSRDIELITNTDIKKDDCPCPEIIESFSVSQTLNEDSADVHLALGMLWLYCDAVKSLQLFRRAKEFATDASFINEIEAASRSIENYLKRINS